MIKSINRKIKAVMAWLLVLIMMINTPVLNIRAAGVNVAGVGLIPSSAAIHMEESTTLQLTATVLPTDADNKNVTWASGDTSVATVDAAGMVTALDVGVTTITVTTVDGGFTDTCTITVYKPYGKPSAPTAASKDRYSVTLTAIDGYEYSMDGSSWTTTTAFTGLSADTEYSFYQRRKASGYYTLSEASDALVVKTDPEPVYSVTGISVSPSALSLLLGKNEKAELKAVVSPSNATNQKVSWSTSDAKVAKVNSSGIVTAVGRGECTITVKSEDGGFTATTRVKVLEAYTAPAAPVFLSKTTTAVELVKVDGFEYSVGGSVWQSSAKFTELNPNTSYFFYQRRAASGYYAASPASPSIIVKTNALTITSIGLDKYNETLIEGEKLQLMVSIAPSDADKSLIKWTSSNSEVASVDSTGMVVAKKPGTTTITVMVNDGSSLGATCKITVKSYTGILNAKGIYIPSTSEKNIVAGLVTENTTGLDSEYSWWAIDSNNKLILIQDWTRNYEWVNWTPASYGDYVLIGKVRTVGLENTVKQSSQAVAFHPCIKGICQTIYTGEGGGYLMGLETYDNRDYSYQMLVMDCTLYAQGKPAWVYTTGKCKIGGNCLWTVWQPKYGYYWTLFRIYDCNGKLVDEICYGFANIP